MDSSLQDPCFSFKPCLIQGTRSLSLLPPPCPSSVRLYLMYEYLNNAPSSFLSFLQVQLSVQTLTLCSQHPPRHGGRAPIIALVELGPQYPLLCLSTPYLADEYSVVVP